MVSKGYSIALENQKTLPHRREYSIYDKRLLTLLYALTKILNFWMGNAFQEEVDLHILQSFIRQY